MSFDIKKVPMVRVTWLDARDTETGWLDIKDVISAPLATCQEVGWLVHNNKEKVIIMRSYSKDKDEISGGGAIAIPKGWVTKIEYLSVDYAEHKQLVKKTILKKNIDWRENMFKLGSHQNTNHRRHYGKSRSIKSHSCPR